MTADPCDPLAERVQHELLGAVNRRRIVSFSVGAKTDDATTLDEVRVS